MTVAMRWAGALAVALVIVAARALAAEDDAPASQGEDPVSGSGAIFEPASEKWTGTFAQMRARGFIRVLVSHSLTNFFIVNGHPSGFEYELMEAFEEKLNANAKPGRRVEIVYVPVAVKDLIPALRDGRGDIIAAGMTITPGRAELVQFTKPYLPDVNEIVVAHKEVKGLRALDDLSGRNVMLVAGSSYVDHLKRFNRDLLQRGLAPVGINTPPADFEAEDVLELVNAGIVELTVVDAQIAQVWAKVLPDVKAYEQIVVNKGGKIAWAIRKNTPQLLARLDKFISGHRQGSLLGNILFKRYFENTKWVTNPTSPEHRKKIDRYKSLIQKYAKKYELDWRLIAAQAYQESQLDMSKRSNRGAIGLMQIKASTAKDPNVAIPNIRTADGNVHAGVKYLAYLRDRYFADEEIEAASRIWFALAAYNAGPANITEMRKRAGRSGRDPNKWFHNVSITTLHHIGSQPVVYVSNINKYYYAYTLVDEDSARREAELEAITDDAED